MLNSVSFQYRFENIYTCLLPGMSQANVHFLSDSSAQAFSRTASNTSKTSAQWYNSHWKKHRISMVAENSHICKKKKKKSLLNLYQLINNTQGITLIVKPENIFSKIAIIKINFNENPPLHPRIVVISIVCYIHLSIPAIHKELYQLQLLHHLYIKRNKNKHNFVQYHN